MGRPPCCDKVGVKKGPWTPEEDIILVSYIQEHGPGNWRSVPTNTGLFRCSKSCRLRWTNYLRPGIKRGNFTNHEVKIIVHLQALLGNRWAAMASYLPQRTDNDIKNYWNTHLKKKLKKMETETGMDVQNGYGVSTCYQSNSKGQWERSLQTDIQMAKRALCEALSIDKPSSAIDSNTPSTTTYASSTENIAKLLQNWTKNTPKSFQTNSLTTTGCSSSEGALDSLFGFCSSTSDASQSGSLMEETGDLTPESKPKLEAQLPLAVLEKWLLFDEAGGAAQTHDDLIDMSLDQSVFFF